MFTIGSGTWRLLILDTTKLYTQIYDEIYGNNPETLSELIGFYSENTDFLCIVLEK